MASSKFTSNSTHSLNTYPIISPTWILTKSASSPNTLYSLSSDNCVNTSASKLASCLKRNAGAVTFAVITPTDFAILSASSPVTNKLALIYPVRLPDWILYHLPSSPSTVSKIVAAQLL